MWLQLFLICCHSHMQVEGYDDLRLWHVATAVVTGRSIKLFQFGGLRSLLNYGDAGTAVTEIGKSSIPIA